ncbi:hypothetical protein HMPREF3185_02101 [Porphyromonas somerae]|uniref:Uncharacterized protein n=1 Tax=Porphyromonas somerae TaxID=322095 RepID=A0A134B094_9PORP|nr:hypothetical protein HMPREF3184_02101 [Porphyromonadaceae bacterium KA00676]KXB73359.1 hypothetical protein HMPREF3185_02101 [Porphyromonas somerae]
MQWSQVDACLRRKDKINGAGRIHPLCPVGFIGSSPVDYGDAGELKK